MSQPTESQQHEHCEICIKMNCTMKPDDVTVCAMVYCDNGCGFRFHSCKISEHKLLCLKEKVPCINSSFGCPLDILRDRMSAHLTVCPASVILCSREWNRWPMHNQDEGWKAPLPFKNPHVKCGQLDVAFALRDQKMLMDSFKTPLKTRRILRNPLTSCYPAVPIQSHSSTLDSPTSEASQLSDDDTGTPWDLTQSPPGLLRTISQQLSFGSQHQAQAAKPEKRPQNNKSLITSQKETEKLVKSFDYVSGKQGLKRLAELANLYKDTSSEVQEVESETAGDKLDTLTIDTSDTQTVNVDPDESDIDIYLEKKKLFEILGVDLTTHFISSYQAKPPKMFTFLCGQEYRRDQYPWHVRNFHGDIQSNLNHWFEQRCPLSYAGCTFSFVRFEPCLPKGTLVHSPVLQTLGFSCENEFQADKELSSGNLTNEEDISTVAGRTRLREATPEIYTSYKCDSRVSVIPRYRSLSRDISPLKQSASSDDFQFSLIDLPFEVLQNIVLYLDSFTIQHLSMTCRLLQSVCCSLLDKLGIVSLVWEKTIPEDPSIRPGWNVTYKRWHFSTGFQPVIRWNQTDGSLSAVHEHLKICPYNQDEHKNIKLEPTQTFPKEQIHVDASK